MPTERNQLTRQAAAPDTITDPAADWAASNWTLKAGQWGFEDDTGQVKLGDGVTAWNDLDYFGGGGGSQLLWRALYTDAAVGDYAATQAKFPASSAFFGEYAPFTTISVAENGDFGIWLSESAASEDDPGGVGTGGWNAEVEGEGIFRTTMTVYYRENTPGDAANRYVDLDIATPAYTDWVQRDYFNFGWDLAHTSGDARQARVLEAEVRFEFAEPTKIGSLWAIRGTGDIAIQTWSVEASWTPSSEDTELTIIR